MATAVFAGYLIKGIDETRCPKEYTSNGHYTVYLRLEPFETKETDPFDVPPECEPELRQFWGKVFEEHVRNNKHSLFSDIEYSESEDGVVLAVHGTSLEMIREDQENAWRNRSASVLELLMIHPNREMKEELNRRHNFRARASEIKFQEHTQRN